MNRWQPKQRDPEKRIVHKHDFQSSSESLQSQPRSSRPSQSKQTMTRCDICSMDVCSVNWKQHIRGKRHKKAMAQRFRCDICGVQSSCESNWKEHIQGKRHKTAIRDHSATNHSKVNKQKQDDIQNRFESINGNEDQKCIENEPSALSTDTNTIGQRKYDGQTQFKSQITGNPTRCKICGAEFHFQMNDHNWNEHIRGKRHKMAAQNRINGQTVTEPIPDCPPKQLVIQTRSEPSNANEDEKCSIDQYDAHCSSKPQQGTQCDENKSTAQRLQAFRCDICGVQLKCKQNWNQHIRGKKHKKALQNATSDMTVGNVENDPQNEDNSGMIECDVCNVTMPVTSWGEHIRGKRHTKNLDARSRSDMIPINDHPKHLYEHQQSEIVEWFPTRLLNKNHKKKIGTLEFPTELKAYAQRETVPSTIKFPMDDSIGRHVRPLRMGCFLEFRVTHNLPEDDSEFSVIKVRIPYLHYRWQRFDDTNHEWRPLSRAESVDLEEQYNPKHVSILNDIETANGYQIRRITRFTGMVLKVDHKSNRGLVQINYPEEYGAQSGMWFNSKDCQFDWDMLHVGDTVNYNIRGYLAVNLTLYKFENQGISDIANPKVYRCYVCNVEFNVQQNMKIHRASDQHYEAVKKQMNNLRLTVSKQCVIQNVSNPTQRPQEIVARFCVSKLHHIDPSTKTGTLEVPSKL